MKQSVVTLANKKSGDITLSKDIFGADVRSDLLHRAVHWQRNNRRQGTHKTKGISEISGGGRKPFAQKGTGNARQGSIRATQMRGGQTVHGPVVRDHGTKLPKKLRLAALRSALSSKAQDKKLFIVDKLETKSHKTKDMVKQLKALKLDSALFIYDENLDDNFARATNNIPHINVLPQSGANVYDILKYDNLVIVQDAVKKLEERLA